jgi:hypothetical protein
MLLCAGAGERKSTNWYETIWSQIRPNVVHPPGRELAGVLGNMRFPLRQNLPPNLGPRDLNAFRSRNGHSRVVWPLATRLALRSRSRGLVVAGRSRAPLQIGSRLHLNPNGVLECAPRQSASGSSRARVSNQERLVAKGIWDNANGLDVAAYEFPRSGTYDSSTSLVVSQVVLRGGVVPPTHYFPEARSPARKSTNTRFPATYAWNSAPRQILLR